MAEPTTNEWHTSDAEVDFLGENVPQYADSHRRRPYHEPETRYSWGKLVR